MQGRRLLGIVLAAAGAIVLNVAAWDTGDPFSRYFVGATTLIMFGAYAVGADEY